MRITNEMTYRMLATNISRNQQSIYRIQQQIASGRKINRPSDDPGMYELVSRLHDDVSRIEQFNRNADRAEHALLVVDDLLQSALKIFHRASELSVRGSDGTLTAADLIPMGKEVDQLLKGLLSLANYSDGGRYVFAGTDVDAKPYTTVDLNADGLIDTNEITYQGNTEFHMIEIGQDIYIESNVPGSNPAGTNAVFEITGLNLFDALVQFRDTLLAGQSATGTTALQDMERSISHIVDTLSTVGARGERIRMNRDVLDRQSVGLYVTLDKNESVDIALAITELSQAQLAYEATLQITGMILRQPSLLDWL